MPTSSGLESVQRRARVPTVREAGVLGALVVFAFGFSTLPHTGIERDMQLVLTVFGIALVLWLTEAVPYVVSSSVAVVLLYALGLVETFGEAASGFASTIVFFLLLLLLLGGAISKVGLGEVVAGRLLSATTTPRSTVRSLAAHMLALSVLMPSAVARAVTFIPVVNETTEAYDLSTDGEFRKASFLILGHVNPIGSMMLMTGGGMAIITSQLINDTIASITWVEWAIYMVPPMLVQFWLATRCAVALYGVNETSTVDTSNLSADLTTAVTDGTDWSLTREQWLVAGVMGGAVVAWIAGSFLGLPTIVPAAGAVVILALPGIEVIDSELVSEVSWGILFLIGAMFSILDAMESTGTLDFVVTGLIELIPFASMAPWVVVGTLLALAVFIRLWFSTASAAIVVTLPIILEFGGVLDVNQQFLALSVLIIVGSTTFFPFNTTSVLLSFDRGPLGLKDVFGFGLVTMVLGAGIIALSWLVYWPFVT